MNDTDVQKQIQQMVRFIRQEAEEKANEIFVAAEEEFNIERLQLVEVEKKNIRQEYERKEKQVQVCRKMKVVHAVGGKVPVLLDGGVRWGTDIFKALALGALAVLIGRPVIYGLAAKGENGVKQVIKMLKDELGLTLALAGFSSIKDITGNHVRTENERHRSTKHNSRYVVVIREISESQ